ncbi:MAG TPA: tetratricopeptide repeat protein, partial [Flavobacteriaceae bacterium]|nr:tetratricopeptide repeat protein [Flavobacteriaceae bacterium]
MKSKILIAFLICSCAIFAQEKNNPKKLAREAREHVRVGNEYYNELKFKEAEVAYKKALTKKPDYAKAAFNLANALYQQNRFKDAKNQYSLAEKLLKEDTDKADVFHNIGNTLMKEKQYAQAVEAYKNALRKSPKDEETRYNLALAQKMQKKDNQNKDNKDNKNKDKDKDQQQNKDNNQDKKDNNKDNKNNPKPKPNKDQNKPQQNPSKLSPEQIKQLLEAMNNEENKTQQK